MITPFNDESRVSKRIALLRYALEREMVSKDSFSISRYGEPVIEKDEITHCLQEKENNEWWVFVIVRGEMKKKAIFSDHIDAIKFFYVTLIDVKDPWEYREKFEKKTGMVF